MSTAARTAPPLQWSLVVPVKVLARAKTRMSAAAGPHRPDLALAVAADTVAAALRCPRVRDVIVVTDDPLPAARLAALGARVVPDEPDAGLNPALVHGAGRGREVSPGTGTGALSADLPALRPDELARVLDAAAQAPEAFVPDAAGIGTTLYTARPGVTFSPAFGRDSRAAHRARGARELLLPDIDSIRRDVDTPSDLQVALSLGVGPRTAEVAARLRTVAPG
ncbi:MULTISPECIES: 2-phospho-L-lactate guanylyltransferase [Actinomadura]|uniref:Phosphoenolpyruvate guanylyltransferase n=1 Tax=Actinomadura litoris TaxID=2678616 RepID=A0A7K1LC57_9ACTN|nr:MULTISPECIES: 2-phospho-L-lactate guanylyltransferase [Actinomadura]MBT2213659.1 2-phospho-L-lactate guanylyltransferase [Actinomadura sp. NEAU-AAG7]MUN42007.1 2-phospho-L-lactate guanylyltransferase [Actinomadura litoris]